MNASSDLFIDTGARFSPCRTWRYDLWRRWAAGPSVLWLLLNPSTADEVANDPTVERCERRSRTMGYGSLYVCNIFALRSTDPKWLYTADDPIGPENDSAILERAQGVDLVVCGWGNHGLFAGRGQRVLAMLADAGVETHCLRVTGAGEPGHPLYIGYGVEPRPLAAAGGGG
ncbi:DUF1643 domain-containing protein [Modicisalibacter sp. MOD 31.J]|uniref:DUF1643 domain-containing protein n=1 Tax=Modicisalibacter sp. MOD 31.J TaxID=2831897 RepID=UPI001CCD7963|nr:DUF1643 domain-containing protein [Modicisalibacter sp. MOD 31.J]MBZ9574644.1 DUF1643 domain-containing protein [Modicisalibacter sp. MOD 31.J]